MRLLRAWPDTMDYFEILGVERKAALGEEEVRGAFQEAGKEAHPDARGGGDFEKVGEAYGVLRDEGRRLRHLLELEFPGEAFGGSGGMVSGELLELFGRAGAVLQAAVEVLKKKREATTALGKAMLEKEVITAQQAVQEVGFEIERMLQGERGRLGEVDQMLREDRQAALSLGREMVERFGFLTKWQAKVREQVTAFLVAE
ncbi:MAG: DnaJ domain-containing protein [Verrucomicrobiota bacterium]